jgi:hypothetical protein
MDSWRRKIREEKVLFCLFCLRTLLTILFIEILLGDEMDSQRIREERKRALLFHLFCIGTLLTFHSIFFRDSLNMD